MAGYQRQDDDGNISNGNIIDATDLNGEFDAIESAFNASTGHSHDGTDGQGARIEETGPAGQFTFTGTGMFPASGQNSLDLGSSSNRFDNAFFTSEVTTANLDVETSATITSLTIGSSAAVTSVDTDLASVSASDDTLASALAIKTYIDAQVTAQDLDISDGTNTGSIDLDSQSLTFSGSTGISATVSGQTITFTTSDGDIVHDNLSGYVAAEHVDHSGVSITAGNGLTGGGTIESTRDLAVGAGTGIAVNADDVALSHLGLEDLTDPGADRVAFWDDSAGAFKWLTMGSNLSITDTTLNATDTDTTYSTATSTTQGLVEIFSDTTQTVAAQTITATSGRTYGSQLNSANQLVVNVPWTDTTYSTATSSALGLVKLGSDTEQTTAAESVTTTASRTYAVQLNSSDQMVVNVPWSDTDTNTTYSAGKGLTLDGTEFDANVSATTQTVAANAVTATNNRTYAIQVDSSDNLVVNVPWVDLNTTYNTATSSDLGLVKLGSDTEQTTAAETVTSTASRTYAVQLNSNDQMVVNVPWVDTNTNTDTLQSIASTTTDAEHYITFVTNSSGAQTGLSHSFLRYNPDSRELYAPNFRDVTSISGNGANQLSIKCDSSIQFLAETEDTTSRPMEFILRNTQTTAADDIELGSLNFRAKNSAGTLRDYAAISAIAEDVTAATEDGSLKFTVFGAGTARNIMEIKQEGSRNKVFLKNDGHFGEAQLVFYNDNTPLTSTKPGLISFGDGLNDYAYATIEGNVTDTGVGTEAGGLVMKVMDYFDQELDEVFTARQASSSTNDEGGTAIRHRNSFVRVHGSTVNLCPNSGSGTQYITLGDFLNSEARFAIETDNDVVLETTQNWADVYLGSQANNGTKRYVFWSGESQAFMPLVNDAYDLGSNIYKWDDIYATNGTIQTSDVNAKQDIEAISEVETRVAQALKGLLRKYRWISAVEEKGDAARYHFGIIAQDVKQAFEDEGLDPFKYAMLTKTTIWTEDYTVVEQEADPDNGTEQVLKTKQRTYTTEEEAPEGATEKTTWGVRYPELLAFIIAGL